MESRDGYGLSDSRRRAGNPVRPVTFPPGQARCIWQAILMWVVLLLRPASTGVTPCSPIAWTRSGSCFSRETRWSSRCYIRDFAG